MNTKKGFTLIEMIIVIAIVGVILPLVFSIIFVVLKQQARIHRIAETRRQGDSIMSFMKEKISTQVVEIRSLGGAAQCDDPGDIYPSSPSPDGRNFYFLDADGNIFYFLYSSGNRRITYESFTPPPYISTALNSDTVIVTNFKIQCIKKTFSSPPLVQIAFDVKYRDRTPTVDEGEVVLPYRTKIRIRN